MEEWDELKKNSTSRKNAPKFATATILFTLSIFAAVKAVFVRLFTYIFEKLNAFLPLPGAAALLPNRAPTA